MAKFIEKIESLSLTGVDLREMNPQWAAAQIEDYLSIDRNFKETAKEIDNINALIVTNQVNLALALIRFKS